MQWRFLSADLKRTINWMTFLFISAGKKLRLLTWESQEGILFLYLILKLFQLIKNYWWKAFDWFYNWFLRLDSSESWLYWFDKFGLTNRQRHVWKLKTTIPATKSDMGHHLQFCFKWYVESYTIFSITISIIITKIISSSSSSPFPSSRSNARAALVSPDGHLQHSATFVPTEMPEQIVSRNVSFEETNLQILHRQQHIIVRSNVNFSKLHWQELSFYELHWKSFKSWHRSSHVLYTKMFLILISLIY